MVNISQVILFATLLIAFSAYPTGCDKCPPSSTNDRRGSTEQLFIYQRAADNARLLKKNDVLKKGDVIQVVYKTVEENIVIVSVDGWGVVTVHFPEAPPCSTHVSRRGRNSVLKFAFELDAAPDHEHFFMMGSDTAIDIRNLAEWFHRTPYEALLTTAPPDGVRIIEDFLIKKADTAIPAPSSLKLIEGACLFSGPT